MNTNPLTRAVLAFTMMQPLWVGANETLPIADVHVHYSHDSVEMTPPERVIELMRDAKLKFALVSSSDDRGTQLLSALAPDIIVPGLRPYRRRGEIGSWFTNPDALAYVERLLATNRYASIGEFHLSGSTADLDIPRRIVELAVEHNLILHAHSDDVAVERLLAQHPDIKVIWAHSGFDDPEAISDMLSKHDRLWADLAFRSDVGSGGRLSADWISLFETHPDRMMLGTDTYTPERMYFLPEHAEASRTWLASLSDDLAEKVAWKNAYDLIMPVWQKNRVKPLAGKSPDNAADMSACIESQQNGGTVVNQSPLIVVRPLVPMQVSEPFSATISVCGERLSNVSLDMDATMPAHGHGMNYKPEISVIEQSDSLMQVKVDGLVLHMPGEWQWTVELKNGDERMRAEQSFELR